MKRVMRKFVGGVGQAAGNAVRGAGNKVVDLNAGLFYDRFLKPGVDKQAEDAAMDIKLGAKAKRLNQQRAAQIEWKKSGKAEEQRQARLARQFSSAVASGDQAAQRRIRQEQIAPSKYEQEQAGAVDPAHARLVEMRQRAIESGDKEAADKAQIAIDMSNDALVAGMSTPEETPGGIDVSAAANPSQGALDVALGLGAPRDFEAEKLAKDKEQTDALAKIKSEGIARRAGMQKEFDSSAVGQSILAEKRAPAIGAWEERQAAMRSAAETYAKAKLDSLSKTMPFAAVKAAGTAPESPKTQLERFNENRTIAQKATTGSSSIMGKPLARENFLPVNTVGGTSTGTPASVTTAPGTMSSSYTPKKEKSVDLAVALKEEDNIG